MPLDRGWPSARTGNGMNTGDGGAARRKTGSTTRKRRPEPSSPFVAKATTHEQPPAIHFFPNSITSAKNRNIFSEMNGIIFSKNADFSEFFAKTGCLSTDSHYPDNDKASG
ncbi:MAG: hypothetical protein NXI16_10380 [Alphaproteobacteria bacterium]|nr:hypothetical protein [Alphaproteobacteria bacterium]